MCGVWRLDDRVSSVSVEHAAGKAFLKGAADDDAQARARMIVLVHVLPTFVGAKRPSKSSDSAHGQATSIGCRFLSLGHFLSPNSRRNFCASQYAKVPLPAGYARTRSAADHDRTM